MFRIAFSGKPKRSLPANSIDPLSISAVLGSNREIDKAEIDLPLPDSPTRTTVSPLATVNSNPSSARKLPSPWPKRTDRFLTSSNGLSISSLDLHTTLFPKLSSKSFTLVELTKAWIKSIPDSIGKYICR